MSQRTCSADGCDRPHVSRGLCNKHYIRQRYGSGDPATRSQRFWSKVDRSGGEDACWLWLAGQNHKGYGSFESEGAHRVAYKLSVGPISAGLHVDHLCRVRNCVNPKHLEIVTPAENTYRGMSYQGANHRKTHCKHGHEFTVENTYSTPADPQHRQCRACRRARSLKWARQHKGRQAA